MSITKGLLRQIIERIERLEQEKADIAADIREVFAEAKANGFDNKVIRQVLKLRKMEASEREEQESLLEIYLDALGMLSGTPLGDAAVREWTQKKSLVTKRDVAEMMKSGAVTVTEAH